MGWSVSAEEDEVEEEASAPTGKVTHSEAASPARPADLAAGLGASAGEMAGVLEAVAAEADRGSAVSDPRVRHQRP